MRNLKQPFVAVVLLMLWSFVGYSQSITPLVNGADVDYRVTLPAPRTHVFTLFGDGNYSVIEQPTHRFDKKGAFPTEAYFVKPYNTNPPALVSTNTNITSTAGTYAPYRPRMGGEIDILYSWCPASQYENFFILAFTNLNSATPIDGCIDFHWHTTEMTMNYGDIKIYNKWVVDEQQLPSGRALQNRKLQWNFTDLKQNERRYIYIPAEVILPPKSNLNLFASYSVQCQNHTGEGHGSGEGSGSGSSGGLGGGGGASVVESPFVGKFPVDPNGKNVFPTCWHEGVEPIQYLEYDINFFNDGNGPANDVVIIDQLSPWLDPSTFVQLASEYDAQITINGQELRIEYSNMNLPGKNQTPPNLQEAYNEEDYSSYFHFGICTFPINPSTPCVINSAKIYFDNQPAVQTTEAVTCIVEECIFNVPCEEPQYRIEQKGPSSNQLEEKIDQLQVWPNPFDQELEVAFNLNAPSGKDMLINIVNVHGVVQRQFEFKADLDLRYNTTLSLDNLPAGLYFMILNVDGEQRIERIMKY